MMIEIINKKRNGLSLTREELEEAFLGYQKGLVKDYQMSALLMAICIQDMTEEEIFSLTDIFLHSGEILDLSFIKQKKVDKHSTGGVGDKTTLIVAPLVASLGIPMIKMSGRGLGFTGGTIDKLESIPGFRVDLSTQEIKKQALDIGIVITSQTEDLTPLDKMIYALRDVTGTTESIPLIASSIMSKKIAGGADSIVIDIKVGEGALIKTRKDAKRLEQLLIKIGEHYHKEVTCVLSNMDTPLGHAIGNKLEVLEAMEVLKGKEKGDLLDTAILLSSHLIKMARGISFDEAKEKVKENLSNGKAYQKFVEWITYQGGRLSDLKIEDHKFEIRAYQEGQIEKISARECASFASLLGAGRMTKEEKIDYDAGVYLLKKEKDRVQKGERMAVFYTKTGKNCNNIETMFKIS